MLRTFVCHRHNNFQNFTFGDSLTWNGYVNWHFLLLAHYVPNIAKEYMTSVYEYIDDRPMTDLASWKILHGLFSATGHPIHFVFGSRVGFWGRQIKWRYFRLDQIQDGSQPPSWNILNGHIPATHHPIHDVFGSGVKALEKIMHEELLDWSQSKIFLVLNLNFDFKIWIKFKCACWSNNAGRPRDTRASLTNYYPGVAHEGPYFPLYFACISAKHWLAGETAASWTQCWISCGWAQGRSRSRGTKPCVLCVGTWGSGLASESGQRYANAKWAAARRLPRPIVWICQLWEKIWGKSVIAFYDACITF